MKLEPSPKLAKLLEHLLPRDLHHLVGDLEEEYRNNILQMGPLKARIHFWYQVLRSAPYFIFQSIIWNVIMLKNYLKVTWRNIRKAKVFSVINILGLAVSMAVCLLIILFIYDQQSYDRFHENKDHIYRLNTSYNSYSNQQFENYATSPTILTEPLQNQFPGIELVSNIQGNFSGEIRYQETTVPLSGIYADTTFFDIFSFKLVKGNTNTALKEPGSIILTEKSAQKIFGNRDPMGKVITALGNRDFTVTGIMQNDYRTHFRFEALVSYKTIASNPESNYKPENWQQSMNGSYLYLLLDDDTDPEQLEISISSLIPTYFNTDPDEGAAINDFNLQSITAINLGPVQSNEIGMVLPGFIAWFLTGFAVVIMLIACFNYVSLTIARSLNRSNEVGVRKVMGAFRSNVIKQFLAESVVITLMALIFASLLLKWLLPEFNSLYMIDFLENKISVNPWNNVNIYGIFLVFSVLVGILAGLYPALYLSSFEPAEVLKGTFSTKGLTGQTLSKIITVSQFSFTILFIITALILGKQFNHMVNTDYGFTREGIVNVALQDVPYDRFRNAVSRQAGVQNIAATSHVPALGQTYGVWLKSDSLQNRIRGNSFLVDEHYIETTGLNLIAGRNFNAARSTDSSSAVILSTEAVSKLKLGTPRNALGKVVAVDNESQLVVGIIENFISSNPLNKGNPIILINAPDRTNYAVVKVRENYMSGFLSNIETTWNDLGSLHSLKYEILDNQLRENPITNIFLDFLKIIGMLSFFSIFISCLGLLGMAMYSAQKRVKEIGIRKVLGATGKDILFLLSREYLGLIGIALVIGTPIAWFANRLWLQAISNKAELGIWIYLAGVFGTSLLALLTVGSQGLRAARTNSIENLRSE